MPNLITLWDGSIGPPPPEPLIALTLGERRAACVKDVLMLSELIETLEHNGYTDCLHDALAHREKLLLWLTRYCNAFQPR